MWVLALCAVTAFLWFWRWRRSGQTLVDFLGIGLWYVYARLWHRWSSNGWAPLPGAGPAILVANHTCSADPAFLTAGCRRRLCFMIAQEFYGNAFLRRLFHFLRCVPVQRHGRDPRAVREALRRLAEGRVLCIFPEGGLSHIGRSGSSPKAGVALLALKSRVPVFPVRITNGPRTSRLSHAWLRPSRVHVTFGPALDLSRFYHRPITRKLLEEVTGSIMEHIKIDLLPIKMKQ